MAGRIYIPLLRGSMMNVGIETNPPPPPPRSPLFHFLCLVYPSRQFLSSLLANEASYSPVVQSVWYSKAIQEQQLGKERKYPLP